MGSAPIVLYGFLISHYTEKVHWPYEHRQPFSVMPADEKQRREG